MLIVDEFSLKKYSLCVKACQLDDPSLDASVALSSESADGRKRLQQLGELSALDTVLHNVDRIPVVCNNNGNAGNVLFCNHGRGASAHVVAIDQCLNPINAQMHPNHLQLYVEDCIELMQVIPVSSPQKYNIAKETKRQDSHETL